MNAHVSKHMLLDENNATPTDFGKKDFCFILAVEIEHFIEHVPEATIIWHGKFQKCHLALKIINGKFLRWEYLDSTDNTIDEKYVEIDYNNFFNKKIIIEGGAQLKDGKFKLYIRINDNPEKEESFNIVEESFNIVPAIIPKGFAIGAPAPYLTCSMSVYFFGASPYILYEAERIATYSIIYDKIHGGKNE
jgi:hypothetical protein